MKGVIVILAALVLSGCLATDPAAREARRQENQSFNNAVSMLVAVNERDMGKYQCRSLGRVVGKGGLAPRGYEADVEYATQRARQQTVRAGGNAINLVCSMLDSRVPRQAVVIADALDCRKIAPSIYNGSALNSAESR